MAREEEQLEWKNVEILLSKSLVHMTGVIDKQDRPLLLFSDITKSTKELSEKEFEMCTRYFINSPCNVNKGASLVVIIDRRKSTWTSVIRITKVIGIVLSEVTHTVHILKPKKLDWIPFFSKIDDVHSILKGIDIVEHKDGSTLETHLGTEAARWIVNSFSPITFALAFKQWFEDRTSIETFYSHFSAIGKKINKIVDDLTNSILPIDNITLLHEEIILQEKRKTQTYEEVNKWTEAGYALVNTIKGDMTNSEQLPVDKRCHIVVVQILLQQIQENRTKFDEFWSGNELKINDAKRCAELSSQLQEADEEHKEIQRNLESLANKLKFKKNGESSIEFDLVTRTLQDCDDVVNKANQTKQQLELTTDKIKEFFNQIKDNNSGSLQLKFPSTSSEVEQVLNLQLEQKCQSLNVDLSTTLQRAEQVKSQWDKLSTMMIHMDMLHTWLSNTQTLFNEYETFVDEYHSWKDPPPGPSSPPPTTPSSPSPSPSSPRPGSMIIPNNNPDEWWWSRLQSISTKLLAAEISLNNDVPSDVTDPKKYQQAFQNVPLPEEFENETRKAIQQLEVTLNQLKINIESANVIKSALEILMKTKQDVVGEISTDSSGQQEEQQVVAVTLTAEQKFKRRCYHIIEELQRTEEEYVTRLKDVVMIYRDVLNNPDNKQILPNELKDDESALFGNWNEIIHLHQSILSPSLQSCSRERPCDVGVIFLNNAIELMEQYSLYCVNYVAALQLLKQIGGDENVFIQSCCQKLPQKMVFHSYLHQPIQRVQKYQLFLAQLKSCVEECAQLPDNTWTFTVDERACLTNGLKTMLSILESVNQSMLQSDIRGYKGRLSERGRLLLHEIDFKVTVQGKKKSVKTLKKAHKLRSLFLYEKGILFCKRKPDEPNEISLSRTPLIYDVRCELSLDQLGLTEKIKESDRSFSVWTVNHDVTYLIQAPSGEVKRDWCKTISSLLMEQLKCLRKERQDQNADNRP